MSPTLAVDVALLVLFSTAVHQLSLCSVAGTCALLGWGGASLLTASVAIHVLRMTRGDYWVAAALGYDRGPKSAVAAVAAPLAAAPLAGSLLVNAPPGPTAPPGLTAPTAPPAAVVSDQPPLYVTAVSVALPGDGDPHDVDRLFAGERLVRRLTSDELARCWAVDPACPARLAGVLGSLEPPALAPALALAKMAVTMDKATLAGVVVGIRACRDAGLLGDDGRLGDSDCGVVYAGSFAQAGPVLADVERRARGCELARKTLIGWLNPASSQLAAAIGARGPVLATSATCAGTTAALAVAQDWLRAGRCRRVVVVSSDDATSPEALPWLASGFAKLGVLSPADDASDWQPFAGTGQGFVLGAGALAIVVDSQPELGRPPLSRLLAVETGNHGVASLGLDVDTTERLMRRALAGVAADELLYLAHETSTRVCADTELGALRRVYGEATSDVLVTATKAMTGHAMGCCFEDAVAALSLARRKTCPAVRPDLVARRHSDLRFAQGRADEMSGRTVAAHFSAGFGGHYAVAVFGRA